MSGAIFRILFVATLLGFSFSASASVFVEPFTSYLTNDQDGYSFGGGAQLGYSTPKKNPFGGQITAGVQGVKTQSDSEDEEVQAMGTVALEGWASVMERGYVSLGVGGLFIEDVETTYGTLGLHYCFVCGAYAEYSPKLEVFDAVESIFVRYQYFEEEDEPFQQVLLGFSILL
jgi:hypothetical protein